MLITFRSQAAGDVIMFGDVAERMLMIIGKPVADKGIVTVEQLPDAIVALKNAIKTDPMAQVQSATSTSTWTSNDAAPDDGKESPVSLSQRALPLLELFEWSLQEAKPVLWEG